MKSHENPRGELIRVRVNPEDIGRVIGRSGRTANAIRTVGPALADHKVRVDIMDVRRCTLAWSVNNTLTTLSSASC